jgi:hypothetical protein
MIADVLQAPETDAGARVERPWVKWKGIEYYPQIFRQQL